MFTSVQQLIKNVLMQYVHMCTCKRASMSWLAFKTENYNSLLFTTLLWPSKWVITKIWHRIHHRAKFYGSTCIQTHSNEAENESVISPKHGLFLPHVSIKSFQIQCFQLSSCCLEDYSWAAGHGVWKAQLQTTSVVWLILATELLGVFLVLLLFTAEEGVG